MPRSGLLLAAVAGLALLGLPAAARAVVAPGVTTYDLGRATPRQGVDASPIGPVALRPDGGAIAAAAQGPGRATVLATGRDGSLDPAFGQGGRVSVDVPYAGVPIVTGLVRRGDGSLVLATSATGTGSSGQLRTALVGLTPTGALDPGFHGGTPLITDLGERAGAVAAANGGLLLTGADAGPDAPPPGAGLPASRWLVERLRPDGSPDATFGAAGTVALPGTVARGTEVAVGPGDRITVLGTSSDHVELRRLESDGTADPGWAGGGALTLGRAAGGLRVRADGAVDVTTGDFDRVSVVRAAADGTLDPAVAPVGLAQGPLGTTLLAGPDGGLVAVTGLVQQAGPGAARVRVQRLDAADALVSDTTATLPLAGGLAAPNHGTTLRQTGGVLHGGAVRGDGTLVLAGTVQVVRYTGEGEGVQADPGVLASLATDGTPDPAFGAPAAPATLKLRVLRQRVRTAVADHTLRVGARTSQPGLIDVRVRGLGHELAHVTLPSFRAGGETLEVLLLDKARSRLRGHHAVTLTVTARLRDVVGRDAAATARGRLP